MTEPARRQERAADPTGCYRCKWFQHDQRAPSLAFCHHPAYQVPTDWAQAIRRGQPCGGDNAPLWEARV